jgi:hypothetical protein
MVASMATMLYIWNFTPIAWTWYVLIGTTVCFTVGYAVSLAAKGGGAEAAT